MAEQIAVKVAEEVVVGCVNQIKHQFRYLSQYHQNIANLSSKVKNLEDKRDDVQDKVRTASYNEQIIKDGVTAWLGEVDGKKAGAEAILKEKERVGNGCWKGWCLNLNLRYSLSKKAVKEAADLDTFCGEGVFETVAHPKRPLAFVYDPTDTSEIKPATSEDNNKKKKKKKKPDHQVVEIHEESESSAVQHVPEEEAGIVSTSSAVGADRGGLESRLSILREVMVAVKNDQIRVVRICGMGGVGKTTMAKEVQKKAKAERLFHEIAMVEVNQNPDLKILQLHIAELFGLELKEDSVSARADRLRERLNSNGQHGEGKNKRILLILDNVWKREDLEEAGIPLADENSRCKILLTSRSDRVCKDIAPEPEFNIEVLPYPEALVLFRQSLRNVTFYDQEIAEDLVKASGGLPISVKTIAGAVSNKTKVEWTVALRKLQKSDLVGEYAAVFKCLKVSYDFLGNEKIKKFFRLCCLFHKGSDVLIEDLARYGMALRLFNNPDMLYEARDEARSYVEMLLHSNLFLRSDQAGCFKVHDHVWDFAMSASSDDLFMVNHGDALTEWPTKDSYKAYTSISLRCSKMDEVPEGLDCQNLKLLQLTGDQIQNLKLLQLTGDQSTRSLKFPENFYERMCGLNVLAFRSMNVLSPPKSLQLLTNLRTLSLRQCFLGDDVSMIGHLGTLEVLSFAHSDIKKLPTEIGNLRQLRMLDLTACGYLNVMAPGVLSCLISLEELYMRGTPLWSGNESQAMFSEIASMSKLGVIDIHIPDEVLPLDSLFRKLKKFKISVGSSVYRFPGIPDLKFDSSDCLFLNSLDLKCHLSILLQEGIKLLLPQAERMSLSITDLTTFLLLLVDSKTVEFSNLKSLSLAYCYKLVYLVNTFGNLHQSNVFPLLDTLHLKYLSSLEEIVRNSNDSIVEPTGMKVMDRPFSTDSWMQSAPFCNLKVLKVGDCNKLKSIFTLSVARGLSALEQMKVYRCHELKVIFRKERVDEGKIRLPNLKYLSLKALPNLGGCYNDVDAVEFPLLEKLKLKHLPLITSLIHLETETSASGHSDASSSHPFLNQKGQHIVCRFQNLRSLKVRNCDRLGHLSTRSTAISFEELQHLEVGGCKSLQAIVAAEGRKEEEESAMEKILLPELNHLHLEYLPSLSTILPKGYTLRWSSLKTLVVESCGGESDILFVDTNNIQRGTTTRPETALTCLEAMQIWGSNSSELWRNHFPDGFSYELRDMRMSYCRELSVLFSPDLIRGFHHLKNVYLGYCNSLEVVFDLEEEELIVGVGPKVETLKELDKIHISSLPSMTHVWKKVPKNFEGFCNLTTLEVCGGGSLRYLFSPSIAKCLVKLQSVNITYCGVMEEVISKTVEEGGEGQKKLVDIVFFPRLQKLVLCDLPSLMCFGPGACDFDRLSFEAPNMGSTQTHHAANANTSRSTLIFNEKVALTGSLEDVEIKGTNRFSYCDKLLVLFSSNLIKGFHHLEKLEVRRCDSLQVVFDLAEEVNVGGGKHKVVMPDQSHEMVLSLSNLPRMTHVWKNGPNNFERFLDLTTIRVEWCKSLRYLFSPLIAKCLVNLQYLTIEWCEEMVEVVSDMDEEGRKNAVDMNFFPELHKLELKNLPSLICLGPAGGFASFDDLSFGASNVGTDQTHDEGNPNTAVSNPIFNEKSSNPTSSALVTLGGIGCSWSLQSLTQLNVSKCHKLISLFPPNREMRLPVLQSLLIENCHSLKYLFSSSTVRSLEQLSDLKIIDCEMMEVIVKDEDEVDEGEEAGRSSKLVFPSLISLTLTCLPNLGGVCLGMLAFEWPSLTSVRIEFCPKIRNFTSGYSITPVLDHLLINSNQHSLAEGGGDVNTTLTSVQQKFHL